MELSIYNPKLADALIHAFYDENKLAELVLFGLNKRLNTIVKPDNLRSEVLELLLWAESEGSLDRLFAAALGMKPNNPLLKAIAKEMGTQVMAEQMKIADKAEAGWERAWLSTKADAAREVFATYKPAGGALEALIVGVANAPLGPDANDWSLKMQESRGRVCKIARDGRCIGTGFLIGPDRVITNSHVVSASSLAGYCAVFDNDTTPGSALAAELSRSDPRNFDYAIFRLVQVPAGNRGYFRVRDYLFKDVREAVSLLGYPLCQTQSFTFGVVFDNNSFMGRVAYTASTAPGSSGSPVFRENWDPVALHHHGEAGVNNHGVPMKAILKDLRDKHLSGLIETI